MKSNRRPQNEQQLAAPDRLPQELIRRKRDGNTLDAAELEAVVAGIVDGSFSDAQVGAFAMAVWLRGLDCAERVALTWAMTRSGTVLDWSGYHLAGPVLDKHSTGGVGDKVSLMLAPLAAACGAYVPMISGRGLGHTGGTLDKLDSIPGYDTAPPPAVLQRVVAETGCAIVGQTAQLAPADRRLYAVRDVTATVDSIGLITASILSKKLAEGLNGLVLDVKTGGGAFAVTLEAARALAESLVTVARGAGLPAVALITDMDQVLGRTAGHALEVREAIDFLTGAYRDSRLQTVVMALGVEMLQLGGLAESETEAHRRLQAALDGGQAAERFAAMVRALGGPADLVEQPQRYLPAAPLLQDIPPLRAGFVTAMDTRAIGLALIRLGAGRRRADERIDHAVGLSDMCQVGEWVDGRCPLARVHADSPESAEATLQALQEAVTVTDTAPPLRGVIRKRLDGPG